VRNTIIIVALLVCNSVQAKNVILFLGDGMGISTITAARIYAGQQQGLQGEEYELSFDKFEHVALVKTYNTDAQVSDSAGTISAILTGEKTRIGVLGITAEVEQGNCTQALAHEIPTLLELAEEAGLVSGIVSTTRITHATPAGAYAHVPSRDWESSSSISAQAKQQGCKDIAMQLVESPHGDGPDVILGGGRAQFLPTTQADPEYKDKFGVRDDARNLIEEWLAARQSRTYLWNKDQFEKFEPQAGAQLMGLFEPSHMQFEADRAQDAAGEPSLAQMTKLALQQLNTADSGFFLLVEAGRIDHGHHFGNAYRALVDTVALADAVSVAKALVDLEETLIVVTADHSHTLTISGYPPRGNPILGKVEPRGGDNARPYTTLSYANGPGYQDTLPDLTDVDTQAPNYQQLATVPLQMETHAGEDVAAFATGKFAERIAGVMEQNKLFHVMQAVLFEAKHTTESSSP